MPSSAKKKYVVTTAGGETVEVTGTRAVQDGAYLVQIFDGDDLVGSFRSYSSFRVES